MRKTLATALIVAGLAVQGLWLGAQQSEATTEFWNGSSWLPHYVQYFQTPIQLTNSMRNWDSDWVYHYNNARGWWNSSLGRTVLYDSQPGSNAYVWIVRPDSDDESLINWTMAAQGHPFDPHTWCDDDYDNSWALVQSSTWNNQTGHWHRTWHKICVWSAPDYNNSQGWHYWWLTLTHEIGHVLSLGDTSQGCLMRDGYSMLYPCQDEINAVRTHYGF